MKKIDVDYLYEWASAQDFPFRRAPTAVGYSNRDIYFCWLKGTRHHCGVRTNIIDDQRIIDILESDEVLLATVAYFEPGTELGPHKDPPVYEQPYRRIQIPLYVHPTDCYMIWQGEKVYWRAGEPQIYDVQDYVHEGYNFSEEPMIFMFVDIRKTNDNHSLQSM